MKKKERLQHLPNTAMASLENEAINELYENTLEFPETFSPWQIKQCFAKASNDQSFAVSQPQRVKQFFSTLLATPMSGQRRLEPQWQWYNLCRLVYYFVFNEPKSKKRNVVMAQMIESRVRTSNECNGAMAPMILIIAARKPWQSWWAQRDKLCLKLTKIK